MLTKFYMLGKRTENSMEKIHSDIRGVSSKKMKGHEKKICTHKNVCFIPTLSFDFKDNVTAKRKINKRAISYSCVIFLSVTT